VVEQHREATLLHRGTRRFAWRRGRPHVHVETQRRCARCGAYLARDNGGELCSCHPHLTGYDPRADPGLDERLLAHLKRAFPAAIDLCAALGTDKHKAVNQGIVRLRRCGWAIAGLRPRGYRLLTASLERDSALKTLG
jgi:biotin operon repressor